MKKVEIKEFTINRKTWNRGWHGGNFGEGKLLNDHGYKCCLGFLGTACGVKDEDLLDFAVPSSTYFVDYFPDFLTCETAKYYPSCNGNVEDYIAQINDDKTLDQEVRESKLTEIFKSFSIKAIFEG